MKNFSLLSLLAIAALSVSISHAAAEFAPFKERIFRQNGDFVGFKEVGPNNWTFCKAIDKNGDLKDPNNWKRVNTNFYRMEENGDDVKFVIHLEGPKVAGMAGKFGGQAKPKAKKSPAAPVSAPSSPAPVSPNTDAQDGETDAGDKEDEAELAPQYNLLFPPRDGGEENDGGNREEQPGRFTRFLRHLAASVDQATAVVEDMPEHKNVGKQEDVYDLVDGTKMAWDSKTNCYRRIMVDSDNKWGYADDRSYEITGRHRNGSPEFTPIKAEIKEEEEEEEESKEDAESKEDGEAKEYGEADSAKPSKAPAALTPEDAENAFAHTFPAQRSGNVFSRAWRHVANSAQQATAVVDEPRRVSRSVNTRAIHAASDAAQEAGLAQDGQPAQTWGAMLSGFAAHVRASVEEATAD